MKNSQLELGFLEDSLDRYFDLPLYFKCKGLFAEPFVGDHLPIDGKLPRTGNKIIDKHWDSNETEFSHFFNQVINTFDKYYPTCKTWNEYQLEDKFIKPILEALGFSYDVQETVSQGGKRSRPDYTLFLNDSELTVALKSKARDDSKYWSKAISVADAKAWSIDLDSDGGPQNCPSAQIVRYLDATVKDWGIITNGRQWRIYFRNCQDRTLKYFEIDLERICLSKFKYERLKYFFYFFRSKAFQKENDKCFLDHVLAESDSYAVTVSNNLKTKILRQAPLITEALVKSNLKLELDEAFKYSLYYCFRVIFILSAESRTVLDVALNGKYHKISLRKTAYDLREQWVQDDKWSKDSFNTYEKMQKLFAVLDQGDESFGLVGFKTNSYANCDKAVFNKVSLGDNVMNELLMELAFDSDKSGKKLFVDYKRVSAEHLGGIFETLLEFKPHFTAKKNVILESATGRKDSGSYYTPDYVVDYLLDRSIKGSENLEKFQILDPACGSGHFIVGAIRTLSNRCAEHEKSDDKSLEQIRSEVAEKCVFGIDRNEVAVSLTKLSIFLSVMRKDSPLPKIDNNIICADSLRDTEDLGFNRKFQLIVGNPPYVNTKLLSKSDLPLKEYLSKGGAYTTCKGCFDLYIPFIEKSFNKFIANGGTIAFVLPNKLMVADYAESSRKFSEELSEEITAIDISHLDVFKGVGVYPYMYIWKTKTEDSPSFKFNVEEAEAVVMGESFAWFRSEQVKTEMKIPTGKVWSAQKKSRKGLSTLADACEVEGGIAGYQAQEALRALSDSKKGGSKSHIPFVVSGSIQKAKVTFGNVRYMKHDFKDPYLNVQSPVITSGKRSLFQNEKIVIAGMTKEIRCFHTTSPLAVGVGVFSITKSKFPMAAVSAVLNSLAFSVLYREKFEAKHLAGGYLAINASQLKDADFPTDISKDDLKNLMSWNKKMTSSALNLKDRLVYEKFVANLLGVTSKEIAKLSIYDVESKEVILALAAEKTFKKAA